MDAGLHVTTLLRDGVPLTLLVDLAGYGPSSLDLLAEEGATAGGELVALPGPRLRAVAARELQGAGAGA